MSTKKKIVPLGDRVLVELAEDTGSERTTKSGLYLPETSDKGESQKVGMVIAVGEGRHDDDGELIPMRVKAGDEVLFSSGWGDKVKLDDEEYYIISESSILAILK